MFPVSKCSYNLNAQILLHNPPHPAQDMFYSLSNRLTAESVWKSISLRRWKKCITISILKWSHGHVSSYEAALCTQWWDRWTWPGWSSGWRLAGLRWRACWSRPIRWARAELYCAGQTAQHETTAVSTVRNTSAGSSHNLPSSSKSCTSSFHSDCIL